MNFMFLVWRARAYYVYAGICIALATVTSRLGEWLVAQAWNANNKSVSIIRELERR